MARLSPRGVGCTDAVDPKDMPQTSLFLATPCYGGQATALYMRSLLDFQAASAEAGLPLHVELGGGEALIGRARAGMLARFLTSEASHLLFVDADIGFHADEVVRLLGTDREVVGAVYPRKPPAQGLEVGDPLGPPDAAGFQRVTHVGAGFLMIRRDAAEKITAAHPELHAGLADVRGAGVDGAAMVFDSFVEPGARRYLSDHEAFCHRWRALDGEVWANTLAKLIHLGASEAL